MKHLKSQCGQSTVEGAVLSLVFVTFVSGLFAILYIVFASYWVEHIMYESLICYQEREQKSFCVRQAESRIRRILVFAKSFRIDLLPKRNSTVSKLEMKIKPPLLSKKIFSFKKELRI